MLVRSLQTKTVSIWQCLTILDQICEDLPCLFARNAVMAGVISLATDGLSAVPAGAAAARQRRFGMPRVSIARPRRNRCSALFGAFRLSAAALASASRPATARIYRLFRPPWPMPSICAILSTAVLNVARRPPVEHAKASGLGRCGQGHRLQHCQALRDRQSPADPRTRPNLDHERDPGGEPDVRSTMPTNGRPMPHCDCAATMSSSERRKAGRSGATISTGSKASDHTLKTGCIHIVVY